MSSAQLLAAIVDKDFAVSGRVVHRGCHPDVSLIQPQSDGFRSLGSEINDWFHMLTWLQICCLCGRDDLKRPAHLCKELFPGLMYISIMLLVRLYMSSTNFSSRDIDSSLISEGMHLSSSNAPVTSGNVLHVTHAVFFPLPEKGGHRVTSCEGMDDGRTGALPWIHCGHQLMDRYASKM